MKNVKILWIIWLMLTVNTVGRAQKAYDFFEMEKEDHWVDSVISTLDLKEKIGQLIFIRAAYFEEEAQNDSMLQVIKSLKPGGVTFFAGEPMAQLKMNNRLQSATDVPLLVSIDGEWGLSMRLKNTVQFPFQMALGAITDNNLIYDMGAEIARECRRMGIHINFAPVIDVNNNPSNPVINYRSFGEDPINVAEKGLAYAKGMQDNGILPTAKHFPGHGDTETDSHLSLPLLEFDRERLDSIELYPFQYLVENGIAGIMVAHLDIPSLDPSSHTPSSLSKPIVTGLLKNEMGYKGMIFSDALEMKGISKFYPSGKAAVESFKAGNDLLLIPENAQEAIDAIYAAVSNGTISALRLEEGLKKVLKLKYRLGLADTYLQSEDGLIDDLNRSEAVMLNRKLIESSITLINDKEQMLPISNLEKSKVVSLSIGVESKSQFQERLEQYTAITSLQVGLKATSEELSNLEAEIKNFDLVIIGLHERYARPLNQEIYSNDLQEFLKRLTKDQKSVVVSFRNPYTLNCDYLEGATALVTTYFDSDLTEDLSAQMVFGGIGFSGKLPVSIGNKFKSGTGIETKGGLRFKYTLPAEVGIDEQALRRRISELVNRGIDSGAYPGAQVLLAKDGKIFYHEAFGFHTYDTLRSVQMDDIYDFASVTKITGPLPALMMLHDQGKFSLDATLSDYVPEMKRSNKGNIQWRPILAHHARLKSWIPYWTTTIRKNGKYKRRTLSTTPSDDYSIKLKDGLYEHKEYRDKIYKMIKKSPLNEKGGFLYSGLSFYLFPALIEEMTGTDYESFLKKNIYQKLGAYTLTYNPARYFELDRMVPTEKDTFFRKMQIHGVVHDEGAAMMDGVSGNAGLFGTTTDLAKLMQMYQNMGSYGGDQYISEYTMKKFTSCQYCEENNHRGLGFDKPLIENRDRGTPAPSASIASFGHTGYTGTFTWADPETGILIVFMSNRVFPTRFNTKLYSLNIRPEIHQTVYNLLGY